MSQISKCPTVVLTYWEASGKVSELGYKSLLYSTSVGSYCILPKKNCGPGNLSSRNHFAHFARGAFGGTWFSEPFWWDLVSEPFWWDWHWHSYWHWRALVLLITALPLLPAPGGQKNNHFYGLIDANLETRKNLLRLFVWNLVAQKLPQSGKVQTGWI